MNRVVSLSSDSLKLRWVEEQLNGKSMTDKQKFLELLASWQVPHTETVDSDCDSISLEAWSHEKIEGYCGFMAIFNFNKDGSFLKIGVWE
jgi:hypothetical protein